MSNAFRDRRHSLPFVECRRLGRPRVVSPRSETRAAVRRGRFALDPPVFTNRVDLRRRSHVA